MVARNEALDALAKAPLFGTLDETGLAAVAQELREASFDSGQNIFSRGDPGTELHIVIKGRVRLSVLTSDGRELSFAHVEPPSIFGELAVFDGRGHVPSRHSVYNKSIHSLYAEGATRDGRVAR